MILQIEVLKIFIPSVYYNELREQYAVAKEKQRKLHARVTKLKEKNAPAHQLLK